MARLPLLRLGGQGAQRLLRALHQGGNLGPEKEIWRAHLRVRDLLLTPDLESRLWVHGTKDAEYLEFDIEVPPHEPGTGRCTSARSAWTRSEIALFMAPFLTREWIYCGGSTGRGAWQNFAGSAWFGLHGDELGSLTEGFRLTGWEGPPGSGALWARKVYDRDVSLFGRPTHELTTIEIWHRPVG